jgi:hypothetical protein
MSDVETGPVTTAETLESTPQQEILNTDDLQVGYLVGLDHQGNFLFKTLGQRQGLVELMGVHAHATRRIETIHDTRVGIGDALALELLRGLAQLTQQVEQLRQVVPPKKPDNLL